MFVPILQQYFPQPRLYEKTSFINVIEKEICICLGFHLISGFVHVPKSTQSISHQIIVVATGQ